MHIAKGLRSPRRQWLSRCVLILNLSLGAQLALLHPAEAQASLLLTCSTNCGAGNTAMGSFDDVLNSVSVGGKWSYDAAASNRLGFTPTNPNADSSAYGFFTWRMWGWALDNDFTVTLDVGFSQPGILVGAFANNGAGIAGGTQRLDIDDLRAFPVADGFKPLRAEMVMHEVSEAVNSVKAGRTTPSDVNRADYNFSHQRGITSENEVLASVGHLYRWGESMPGAPLGRVVADPTDATIRIWEYPWFDTMTGLFKTGKIAIRGGTDINKIAAGLDPAFFDDNYVFSAGTGSIDIVGLGNYSGRIEPIPEPTTLALAILALGGLGCRRRRPDQ